MPRNEAQRSRVMGFDMANYNPLKILPIFKNVLFCASNAPLLGLFQPYLCILTTGNMAYPG
jgi:hypothetical protein